MFSIVTPVWNKRHTIALTVAGVLAQRAGDFELIVVDDGSTDGSMEVIAGLDDPRIRRLAQPNAGPGAARNAGIAAARGDWIAFLDADDIWLPDHLEELDRVRRAFPEAGLIGTGWVACRINGHFRPPVQREGAIELIDYLGDAYGGLPLCTSAVAVQRSVVDALGGFIDAVAGQDLEYWSRIALDRAVAMSRRVTSVYRLETGGISDTVRSHWLGKEIREIGDIGPSVAMLVERYPGIESPALRASVDGYIDRQFRWCVRMSAAIGDFRTLRAVGPLFPRPPAFADRLILALARLPAPLARAAYWLGFRLKALGRLLGLDQGTGLYRG